MTGQDDRHVVVVVGDGALTGGMTWEALNNISHDNSRRLVIIVNDNGRSYAPTIGGVARFLSGVRTRPSYRRLHMLSWAIFKRLGGPARALYRGVRGGIRGFMARFANNDALYSNLDIKYIGPIDGHNMADVERALEQAKDYGTPVIVHAITEKGRGYEPARMNADDQFHAIGAFDPITGEETKGSGTSWTSVFSSEMVKIADENESVVGITAAMLRPTGLAAFADKYPGRVVDVGIAEQHATTSAAGLAFGGLHPVVAVYATFMGRAFDQLLMDVALHRAGVTFVLDRAGVTGPDGASHHGQWDLAMLNIVPGIRIAAPRDDVTLREELREAVAIADGPTVVRFPKGNIAAPIPAVRRTKDGVDVLHEDSRSDVLLVAIGAFAPLALAVAEKLTKDGFGVTVVDPRWVIPVPQAVIDMSRDHRIVVSIEDGIRVGGVGTRIRQDLRAAGIDTAVDELGLPAEFLEHDTRDNILRRVGLDADSIAAKIRAQLKGTQIPKAKP
jgi:1-deoxy-D-xylulose-5-phosphate synthase